MFFSLALCQSLAGAFLLFKNKNCMLLILWTSFFPFPSPLFFMKWWLYRPYLSFRHQYRTWKAECQKMVPVIGSGRFITAPIINDDRQMIEDSSSDSNLQDDNGVMATSLVNSSLDHGRHVSNAVSEKKVIQWKLNLHQIGIYPLHWLICYWIDYLFLLELYKSG